MGDKQSSLDELIQKYWIEKPNAEWVQRTDVLQRSDLQEYMKSGDVEVLGFVYGMIDNGRFRIEPSLSLDAYVRFIKYYFEKCFRENPQGSDWANSSYEAGWDLVRIFIKLWDYDPAPRQLLLDMKDWLAAIYKSGDERLRTCIAHASLEHMFERKPIRKFFADWRNDSILAAAYEEACLWDRKTPLSEP